MYTSYFIQNHRWNVGGHGNRVHLHLGTGKVIHAKYIIHVYGRGSKASRGNLV
jgi:hypothetical protein